MYKIEAIIREEKFEDVKEILAEINVHGITVSQVMGCGTQKGYEEVVRGNIIELNMRPRIKLEIVVSSEEWADKIANSIQQIACTGNIGDGKIFIYEIKTAIRISTGEKGEKAIWPSAEKDNLF
ncbi:MAG: P-II family nitrogen regulator [Clostridia bacterium]|nr:P-II family nitrogen regulator [Clostridia bacterium]